ncbi:MAG: PQQ-dependent sugar dehydrogenase [Candidatus Omnitrophota bacterium]|nr:PQQ-dependent sugar dehydrogenase [Candidatus Omnitrophota bacterium]
MTRKRLCVVTALGLLFLAAVVMSLAGPWSNLGYRLGRLWRAERVSGIIPLEAFPHLTFEQPVDLQHSPDGSDRLFVVEQKGMIRVFQNIPATKSTAAFLDIRDRVFAGHMEEGLLGLAFHPQYRTNGLFYVYYSAKDPRRSVLARFQRSASNPVQADIQSQSIILEVPQPYGNHNGGQIAFGPDGYLYVALGDGGGSGDPHGNGQNLKTLLGKILRIDVDRPVSGRAYGIPPDNPFVGHAVGGREEIYAYGLRNPWRFSFDPLTKQLWAGDVGQDKPLEEVNIIRKGKNYGWNILEGRECFNPPQGCSTLGLELPVWQYTSDKGRSITGGYVYRGKKIPGLYGKYIYADFMSGNIWALASDGKKTTVNKLIHADPGLYISSFGVDQDQELYFCSFNGNIYRLAASPQQAMKESEK